MPFELQILHAADQEAGLPALDDAPRFSAIVNALRDDYANTVILSSGDAYIPGPFFSASSDPSLSGVLGRAGVGRADILIQNDTNLKNKGCRWGCGGVAPSQGFHPCTPFLSAVFAI